MKNAIARYVFAVIAVVVLAGVFALPLPAAQRRPISPRGQARIEREVRHELVMLPFYNVFDWLEYKVNGGTVTLMGQVTRPVVRTDAGRAVQSIEGVERVINNIEVLPLSGFDDQIRMAEFRAIYSETGLQKYALQAVPPIHIIVKNGHVTLKGVVDSEMDKNLAGIRANGVPGVFSVDNQLQVAKPGK